MTAAPVDLDDDDHVAESTFREPSRHWYHLAAAVVVLGIVASFAWFDHAMGVQQAAVARFTGLPAVDVAAGASIEVGEPGEHTVWAGAAACAGFCRPASAGTLQRSFTLEIDGPAEVAASSFDGAQYFNHGAGGEARAVWSVRFPEAGTYRLRLIDEGDLATPPLWVGRGHGLPVRIFRGSVAIAVTALAVATALAAATFRRRRRFYADFAARQRARGALDDDADPTSATDHELDPTYALASREQGSADDAAPGGGQLDDETFDTNLGVLTKRLNRPDAEAGPKVVPTTQRPTPPPAPEPPVPVPPIGRADDAALDSQLTALTSRLGRAPIPAPAPTTATASAGATDASAPAATPVPDPPTPHARPTPGDDRFDSSIGVLAKRMHRRTADGPTAAPTPTPAASSPPDPEALAPSPAAAPAGDDRFDSTLGVLAKRLGRTPAPTSATSASPTDLPPAASDAPEPASGPPTPPVPPTADPHFDATVGMLARRLARIPAADAADAAEPAPPAADPRP